MMEVIHSYSRKEAIADGVLIDVSEMASECGIRYSVVVTSGVWAKCVEVPEGVEGQDEEGRLWDVLTMFRYAIRKASKTSSVSFSVLVRSDHRAPKPVDLYAVCGPGDDSEPVITIMLLLGED